MIVLILFLSLIAFVGLLKQSRRTVLITFSSIVGLVLLVGYGVLPYLLLRQLQTYPAFQPKTWQARNAIVILGMGSVHWASDGHVGLGPWGSSRLWEALRLYHRCINANATCTLLVTGGDPQKNGVTEAEIMATELKSVGVLEAHILLETQSQNTFQNAQFSKTLLQANDLKNVIIVTSGFHMTRSLRYFEHFHISAAAAPSDELNVAWSWAPSAYNFMLMDMALHEIVGTLRLGLYDRLGLNPAFQKPGDA